MKGLLTFMMIVLVCVMAAAVYKIYKVLKSTGREESAREAFLEALCEETARKKREREESDENVQEHEPAGETIKQETQTVSDSSEAEKAQKEAAVNMVMNMLGGSRSKGSAADELHEMMRSLSEKNKADRNGNDL